MAFILSEIQNKIGIITLNNPTKRNALCSDLLKELIHTLEVFKTNKLRVVIIRAAADTKIWSSGHDINELPLTEHAPLDYNDPLEKAIRAIREFPAPIIAMVHGSVWGGACDFVLNCDMVIGDETSAFAITPVNIGIPYNTDGILNFIRRLPLNFAKEMFFTAQPVNAERAKQFGILNYLVTATELENFTLKFAQDITHKSPLAIAVIKEQFRLLTSAHPLMPEIFERLESLRIQAWQSKDYKEGIKAFLEKRSPNFIGE